MNIKHHIFAHQIFYYRKAKFKCSHNIENTDVVKNDLIRKYNKIEIDDSIKKEISRNDMQQEIEPNKFSDIPDHSESEKNELSTLNNKSRKSSIEIITHNNINKNNFNNKNNINSAAAAAAENNIREIKLIKEVNEDEDASPKNSLKNINRCNHKKEEKLVRNQKKKVSILKPESNQTHKTASTSAASNAAEFNVISMFYNNNNNNNNNKSVLLDPDADSPYGISNIGNSARNSAANSAVKDPRKPKDDKHINPFKILNNNPSRNLVNSINNYNCNNRNDNDDSNNNRKHEKTESFSFREKPSSIKNLINSIDSSSRSSQNFFNGCGANAFSAGIGHKAAKNTLSSSTSDSFFNISEISEKVINEEAEEELNKTTTTNQNSKIGFKLDNTNKNIYNSLNLNKPEHFQSSNKNLPQVIKDEINSEVYISKLNRENLRVKHIPVFKNQFKLNNHLIRDFQIGMVSNPKRNSLQKYTMTEKLHLFNEKKRMSIREEYIKSIYGSNDCENGKARAKTSDQQNNKTNTDNNHKFG